ncbi:hypothetical protein Goklo_027072 [Gossypium klotzschianum]|uniref:Branched-chain-amino-acid aminotransferase n=1 Tax=Gossypium klotzschianum TaxID=34286 RepID=A0A7J8TX50_9ROSI|nr:hypothetical protein [Gossypium klotzschianum]
MGTGRNLEVKPSSEYTFLVYASPVGNGLKGVLNLMVEDNVHRATPGGTGGIKAVTNYSPISYLDALTGSNIEECSGCNIFILKVKLMRVLEQFVGWIGNVISTPTTHGTILPGITRKSIMEIASAFGYQVEERAIPIKEVFDAEEVFCTGTAMIVKSVASITYQGKRIEYKLGEETLAQKLHATLTGIQTGVIEDKLGWTMVID